MKDIREISSLLDETIEKGEKVTQSRIEKSKKKRQSIRKALSFNPMSIHEMTPDSLYHNPYDHTELGFMPKPPGYWQNEGRGERTEEMSSFHRQVHDPEAYREVKDYYSALDARPMQKSMSAVLEETVSKAKLPVGTVHMWNGAQFQKVAEGKWEPVHEGAAKDHPIEQSAGQHKEKLKQELEARKRGEKDEPSFADRAKKTNEKHREVDQREKELQGKETEHKERMLDMREQELDSREKELGNGDQKDSKTDKKTGKAGDDRSKKEDGGDKDKQKVLKDATGKELKAKVARREPGKGEHVDLTKGELDELLGTGTYAFVSAGKNPNDEKDKNLSDEDIKARYDDLEKELVGKGYAYTKVRGHYGESEDSFLVMAHEADRDHIADLGKRLNQDSVIYSEGGKHEMIYTSGESAGKKHDGEGHEIKPDADDFYTEITHPDGEKTRFSLNFDFDNTSPADGKPKTVDEHQVHADKHGFSESEHPDKMSDEEKAMWQKMKGENPHLVTGGEDGEKYKLLGKTKDGIKKSHKYLQKIGSGKNAKYIYKIKPSIETKAHKSTYHQHSDESGEYKPERKKLHDEIINKVMEKVGKSSKPVMILSGGGSASGKSSVLKSALPNHSHEVAYIDSDAIKENIPEYKALVKDKDESAAAHTHLESSHVASEAIRRAMEDKKSFVYDSTMKNQERIEKLTNEARSKGYDVHIIFADLDKNIAHERASKRAEETGRKVPEEIIHASHEGAIKTLGNVHHLADSVTVYSTKGDKPEIAYKRSGDKKEINDDLYRDMVKRGHVIKSDGDDKSDNDLIERIIESIKGTKVEHDGASETVDDGVAHDEYPRDRGEKK